MSFLFTGTRVRTYWDVAGVHLPIALVTGLPLWLPHIMEIQHLPMGPCTLLSWTGYPCPFCGFTRAFWAMAHGDWQAALTQTPLSGLVYLATALLFAWHGAALILGVRIRPGSWFSVKRRNRRWVMASIVVLFMLNWAYRSLFMKSLLNFM